MPNLYQFECGKGCSKALESGFPPIFFLQIQPKVQPSEVMAVVGPFATGYPLVTPELSWNSDQKLKIHEV
jgi:hypothetical protein